MILAKRGKKYNEYKTFLDIVEREGEGEGSLRILMSFLSFVLHANCQNRMQTLHKAPAALSLTYFWSVHLNIFAKTTNHVSL